MATRTRRAVRRGARGPGVPRDVRPAPPAADAASIPRWHAIVECVSAAYDHPEPRPVVDTARAEERKRWRTVQQVVDQQAEDEVLGFTARTAPEAYLQQELRKLHAAVKRR